MTTALWVVVGAFVVPFIAAFGFVAGLKIATDIMGPIKATVTLGDINVYQRTTVHESP